MTAPEAPRRDPPALLAGWAAVALVDMVVLTIALPAPTPIGTRAATLFYDAAQLLAIAFVATGVAALWRHFGPKSRWIGVLALTVIACAAGRFLLVDDLSGPASHVLEVVPLVVRVAAFAFVASLMLPGAVIVGGLLARGRLRVIGVIGGSTIAVVNGLLEEQASLGVHLFAAVTAIVLVGRSLEGAEILAKLVPADVRKRRAITAGAALAAATSLVVWPSNAALLLLTSRPSAALVPFLARLRSERAFDPRIPEDQREWFVDRSALPPIPPSAPRLLGSEPIVIVIGVDSLRGDLIADEKYRARMPEMFRLRDQSVYFSDARAPGSSTVPSLSAMFSGLYYSQLYWSPFKKKDETLPYPHQDPRQRFPELLSIAGVRTATCDSTGWLVNEYGVVRGFREQESARRVNGSVPGPRMMSCVIARMKEQGRGPLFVFAHLLDAHTPYTSAGRFPSPFDGYVAELGIVDAQIRRLRDAIAEAHLEDRTTLVLISDHGDAFGEHGLTWHARSVYDELLRVPIMIKVPGVRRRVVADPVSLIDLGPTILDLMGVDTPARFMGQSLVGFLRGQRPVLTRPILAEARLKRTMLLPNHHKIIHDTRSHAVEIFDLAADPRELSNLYVEGSASSAEQLAVLSTFFAAQKYQKPGYKVPYRRW